MPSRAYEASSRTCTCSPFSWACTVERVSEWPLQLLPGHPPYVWNSHIVQPSQFTHLDHGLCRSELCDNMHGSA